MPFLYDLSRHIRVGLALGAMVVVLAACSEPVIVPLTLTPTPGATPTLPASQTPTSTATPTATVQSIQLPTPLPTTTVEPSPTPETAWLPGEIHVFPGPMHYDGDLLSIEVVVENITRLPADNAATLSIDQGDAIESQPIVLRSTQSQDVLLFRWVWDTTGRQGLHQLNVFVPLDTTGRVEELIAFIDVQSADARPHSSQWLDQEEFCCLLHYLSDTAAARDIQLIQDQVRDSVTIVEETVGFAIDEKPYDLAVIDTIWPPDSLRGHPPFVSYVDRNYLNQDLDISIRRWAANHALQTVNDRVPTILREGAIDYVAGGHYYPEDFPIRAAALVELGAYVPLADLANGFHRFPAEVAYLEAAAFVQYLAETYTWPQFLVIYALQFDESGAQWLDRAFQLIVFKDLDLVEREFLVWLDNFESDVVVENVDYTLRLYETIRRYQVAYAPVQVALPDLQLALDDGVTGDFVRRANEPENIAIETLLIETHLALTEGRTVSVEAWLGAIEAALQTGDFTQEPLADYVDIVDIMLAQGVEPQRISIAGDVALVESRDEAGAAQVWNLTRTEEGWHIFE